MNSKESGVVHLWMRAIRPKQETVMIRKGGRKGGRSEGVAIGIMVIGVISRLSMYLLHILGRVWTV